MQHPGRIVLCDQNTEQILLLLGNCMDYNEEKIWSSSVDVLLSTKKVKLMESMQNLQRMFLN